MRPLNGTIRWLSGGQVAAGLTGLADGEEEIRQL